MRFKRKKPILVDAYQAASEQLVGTAHCKPGDWIVTSKRGKKTIIADGRFRALYAPEVSDGWPNLLWCHTCKEMMKHRRQFYDQVCERCSDRSMRKASKIAARMMRKATENANETIRRLDQELLTADEVQALVVERRANVERSMRKHRDQKREEQAGRVPLLTRIAKVIGL